MRILPWKSWLRKTQRAKRTESGRLLKHWILFRPRTRIVRWGSMPEETYKQLLIDNYVAILKIDEQHKTVYIVTVQYQGRNV